jgi:Domain of unknown function (DUF4864)
MEVAMLRFFSALVFALLLLTPASAEDVSAADKQSFQHIISGQLDAFKSENGPLAYSFAAPLVTTIFPTVDNFMAMVKRGYAPVYNNEKYQFGKLETDNAGRPAQHVTIITKDGKRYEAVYALQKQADGSWKIAGCSLVEIPGVEV